MRVARLPVLLALSLVAASTRAVAQRPVPDSGPPGRQALEQRVRQRMAAVVQQRLGLTADQMRRLGEVNREMEAQRRTLHQQERDVRIGLRAEVMRGDSANQDRVAGFVDQLIDVQRRRIELLSREQRALASFMTPVQRAKYLALQDQLRRRMEEMRGRPGRGGQRRGGAVPQP
jgi:TolA-binding protein